jgi:hypothetical protein
MINVKGPDFPWEYDKRVENPPITPFLSPYSEERICRAIERIADAFCEYIYNPDLCQPKAKRKVSS